MYPFLGDEIVINVLMAGCPVLIPIHGYIDCVASGTGY